MPSSKNAVSQQHKCAALVSIHSENPCTSLCPTLVTSLQNCPSNTEPVSAKKKRTKDASLAKRDTTTSESPETSPAVKGGRKTRGSKIVTKQQIASTVTTPSLTNVILNLKCSMSDLKEYNNKLSKMISNPLEYNSSAPPEVKYYDGESKFGSFIQSEKRYLGENLENEEWDSETNTRYNRNEESRKCNADSTEEYKIDDVFCSDNNRIHSIAANQHSPVSNETHPGGEAHVFDKHHKPLEDTDDVNVKDMSAKIKQLKIQLYKNTLQSEKKSACFWCTYDFDNAPCYIPKYEMDGTIYGYGSFCRPECAVAYLMKETIDDSTKFDRYHLLNQIYSKVYDCKKNIKPAPDPHYLLDKFYGNLNIQEYRRLLKTEHLLLVIDKPLTRILPELHEDTDDAFTKIYGIKATSGNASGVYKVKRQSEQPHGPSKASIIRSTFGI